MPSKYRARSVICTDFKYGEDAEAYLLQVSRHCSYVIGQLEKCPTTKRLYLQFLAHNKNSRAWPFLKCHKETCHYGKASERFCSKEITRIGGPWEFGEKPSAGGRPKVQKPTAQRLLSGDLKKMVRVGRPKAKKLTNEQLLSGDLKEMVRNEIVPLSQYIALKKAKEMFINDELTEKYNRHNPNPTEIRPKIET